MRGNSPRQYRNSLVFLAADRTRLQDLEEAARFYIAWKSILDDEANLGLTHHQKKQVETQIGAADSALKSRVTRNVSLVVGSCSGETSGYNRVGIYKIIR